MDFNKIYSLSNQFKSNSLHVRPMEEFDVDKVLKEKNFQIYEPLKFEFHSGKTLYDLIGTTNARIKLVSDRFINLLKEKKFEGWSSEGVIIHGKDSKEITGYNVFRVHGTCGPIDKSKSLEVLIPPKSPKGKERKGLIGLFFDHHTWDGSQIFSPENTGFIFVTEEVKVALNSIKASNVEFTEISKIENVIF